LAGMLTVERSATVKVSEVDSPAKKEAVWLGDVIINGSFTVALVVELKVTIA